MCAKSCYINVTMCEKLTKMNAALCNIQLGMPFPNATCKNRNQGPRVMSTFHCCFRTRTPFPQCLGNYFGSSICTHPMGCFHSQNKEQKQQDQTKFIMFPSTLSDADFSSSFHCCSDAELLAQLQLKTRTW